MDYGIDASCPQYIKGVFSFGYRTADELVDVTQGQIVRMLVIRAKEQHLGIIVDEVDQSLKVFGGGTFTNRDFHAEVDFFQGFLVGKAFVIGAWTCGHILLREFPT